jgi:hypothetical protein
VAEAPGRPKVGLMERIRFPGLDEAGSRDGDLVVSLMSVKFAVVGGDRGNMSPRMRLSSLTDFHQTLYLVMVQI